MNEIIFGVLISVILIVVFLLGKKKLLLHAESEKIASRFKRETWAKKSIMSYGQIQQLRKELVESMEEKLADQPEQLERFKEIIDDWTKLKIKTFEDRRSWVRKPGEKED